MSHTTDDLIFEWYPVELIPLVVEPIQLPQLELIHNTTEDCTTSYSTGERVNGNIHQTENMNSKVKSKNTIVHVHGILQCDRGEPDKYEFVRKKHTNV